MVNSGGRHRFSLGGKGEKKKESGTGDVSGTKTKMIDPIPLRKRVTERKGDENKKKGGKGGGSEPAL